MKYFFLLQAFTLITTSSCSSSSSIILCYIRKIRLTSAIIYYFTLYIKLGTLNTFHLNTDYEKKKQKKKEEEERKMIWIFYQHFFTHPWFFNL